MLVIFEPFSYMIKCNNEHLCREGHFGNIYTGIKDNIYDLISFIRFLYLSFSLFLTALGLWLTVKYLSASHFITTDAILTFALNILFDIFQNTYRLVFDPWFYLASLLTIFGCFVYNEIIILNIFGLNYNTRKEIEDRERIELTMGNKDLLDNETASEGDSVDSGKDDSFNLSKDGIKANE